MTRGKHLRMSVGNIARPSFPIFDSATNGSTSFCRSLPKNVKLNGVELDVTFVEFASAKLASYSLQISDSIIIEVIPFRTLLSTEALRSPQAL
ncbi:hypothetical protein CYMTET_9096 [Cymbomonas tetramitiformis]|uniref:Uncharacterized protein n=1 Tax=Cymbomonas tetramitiformis TaxID=36881 RepID=A0AAE0GRW6_9CHLO|nr:hypothetical protein CYMTET_9096 [Cymbomonas tetramitiformis]